jgi:aminoglycoside phosphotransferase (APT) family kinase protein
MLGEWQLAKPLTSGDFRGTRYIMRKKPPGDIISAVAHQVDREFRVLKSLSTVTGFPVPKVYCLCEDPSIIGTSFYVSERIFRLLQSATLTYQRS